MRKSILLISMILLGGTFVSAQKKIMNSIGMEFVLIDPGSMTVGELRPPYPVPDDTIKDADRPYTMWMGDGRHYNAEEFRLAREMATRDTMKGFIVKIEKPYYLGKFEVTQGQWKKVMRRNPATFKNGADADNRPVESISWNDAKDFIKKLNKLEKTNRYRLPTEFEWEYAARAGATEDIPWDQIQETANLSKKMTALVGSKQPNAWGIYDMLGNVWEWVEDYYNEKIFADPVSPSVGNQHVLKGASFTGDVKNATYLTHAAGPGNGWDIGFRVLMDSSGDAKTSSGKNDFSSEAKPRSGKPGALDGTEPQLPNDFKPIFNGKDLNGWHTSRTSHQGTIGNFYVEGGVITLKQNPYGQGGVLLTDLKYKDFELYVEVKIDSFCNGGIFLRSTESGQAYQIELANPGGTGGLFGEAMEISLSAGSENIRAVWKPDDWNAFRIRMVGEVPTLTLWINDHKMWEVTQPRNDFTTGAVEGMIGLQSHWTALYQPIPKGFNMPGAWRPGAAHRFRNLGIKKLN